MAVSHIFTGITSEGGLLPSDFLAALGDPKSGIEGLDPVTYRLAPGERLGDQVNRSWNRLKGCWVNFQRAIMTKQAGEPTTTETRERWLYPLFQELDFGRLTGARPIEIDGKSYPVSHGWGPVPIQLVGTHVDLDHRTPGAVGAAKASPHSLVQQVINASDDHLWGIISNGFTFRLVRDNITLTRIAYVEWDLQTIFEGDLYPEFFLLWLVCHQTRFEAPSGGRPDQCWLEKWKKQAEEKGLRALENLRPGVEKAIAALGAGLVSHKANQALRSSLSGGQLSTQDFYRQILRVVYRMLFLFVAEDRGLLHPPLPGEDSGREAMEAAIKARRRYQDFYSLGRLRELTLHRAGTPHPDLWSVFGLVSRWLGTDNGCPELALPPLGSFLWSPEATPDLNGCLVSNRHLLEAIHALTFVREGKVRRTVDYKNMGSEELGSVYESLLEQHPVVNADAGTFDLQTAAGHERKTSGSYYTPDSLVQCLLDSALEPVMAEASKGKEGNEAADALLKLRICDPAVGSGHFLIAAAHRLARRIAAARTGEEEPSPDATRSALRDVISRCLYGVDVNPMAAELCRVSLWLEALEPGKPLSFLDHHIRVGNSLLGTTPELIASGLPDDAFKPIEGDDNKVCSALKKRNRQEREGQRDMFHLMVAESKAEFNSIESRTRGIDEVPDDTIDDIHRKSEQFHRLVVSPEYRHAQQIADAWCSAFVWKRETELPLDAITTDTIRRLEQDPDALSDAQRQEVERLTEQYRFFHWHLVFPEVFAKGGFDCVLGNPPWERVKLQEKEWFAECSPEIANAPNAAARKRMIKVLKSGDPGLYRQFLEDLRKAEGESHLLRNSGLYPLCGRGDINLYAVFAEAMLSRLNASGSVGAVLPSGIATDDTTKLFFQRLIDSESLVSFFDFWNRKQIFPGVQAKIKFCLLTLSNVPQGVFTVAAQLDDLEMFNQPGRVYNLSPDDVHLINPNTRNCPTFISSKDASINRAIYRRMPITSREDSIPNDQWSFEFSRMFDMTNEARYFRTLEELSRDGFQLAGNHFCKGEEIFVPLYEAKLAYQYDHRPATFEGVPEEARFRMHAWANETQLHHYNDPTYAILPRFWINKSEVLARVKSNVSTLFGFRNTISAVADSRSLVASLLPIVGVGNSLPLIYFADKAALVPFFAAFNSIVLDYVVRQKASGGNLNYYVVKQMPLPTKATFGGGCDWSPIEALYSWLMPRVLELTYTAWDLEAFAHDCGWSGPPFRWDEERRFLLRCELDAAFFHLYLSATNDAQWKPARIAEGAVRDETPAELAELRRHFPSPRDAVAYIMDTFPIVRRKDEEKHGDYRTKRVILEIYDEMGEAIRTGSPYQTRLDPPPGPLENGLPEWKPGQPKPLNWPSHIHPPKGRQV